MVKIISITIGIGITIVIILSVTIFKDKIKSAFYIDHMERDERTSRMNIEKIIEKLNIKSGSYIADVGAGSGLFARKFSPLVGSQGKIFAVDINSELLKHIDLVNKENNIQNIITIQASENNPNLPEAVDLLFICDTLHYINNQEQYVKTLAHDVKPGGRIAVVSFLKRWPPMSNKFGIEELTLWMNNAGMQKVSYYDDFIQDEYLAIFTKR